MINETYQFKHANEILAIQASALNQEFTKRDAAINSSVASVAVVEIIGPLMHHVDPWCDSYDSIKERVKAALSSSASCVLLSIDSPGGLVNGLFDTVQELRALAYAASKPIYCYVDSTACSAAYILACAAEKIWVPTTGTVGSIGLIEQIVDATAQDTAMGLKVHTLTSGARKADGNPHTEKSADSLAAMQSEIDTLAETFFALVASHRPITVDAIRDLQAGVLHGAAAVSAGLADDIATFDQVVSLLNSNPSFEAGVNSASQTEKTMKLEEIKEALAALTDEEKKEALAMLAAEDEPKEDKEQEPKAEDEHKEPDADDKGGPSDQDEDNEDKKAIRALQKQMLLMSRPDLSADKKAELQKQSLEVVQFAVTNLPKMEATAKGPIAGALAGLNVKSDLTQAPVSQPNKLDAETERFMNAKLGVRTENIKPELVPDAGRYLFKLPALDTESKRAYLTARAK